MNVTHARPFPVDEAEYPFTDHWSERDGVAMHYVDEGVGIPVLMLHVNPTWSYLYRNIIRALDGECRRIAPDYPGFGFSDHPRGYAYTPQEHAQWIAALVDELRLDPFVLVIQDWGGPIGLSIAVDRPDRVAGLVICNTWCWPPNLPPRIFSYVMGGPFGRYLQLRQNFFARVLLPAGIYHKEKKTSEVRKAYTDPFPTPDSRIGTYVFPWAIRNSDAWLQAIESRLHVLQEKPIELVWGMKDFAFGRELFIKRWHSHFPDAPVDRIDDASHFLQEDRPERVVAGIQRALKRVKTRLAG